MASDTEDLELESLRSAVLASLKTKPVGDAIKASASSSHIQSTKPAADEDDDDEDLEALRLAALQSKKESGSASHISTPVTGSPHHASSSPNPQAPRQDLPFKQEPPVKPDPASFQRGAGKRSNLITIPLQDLAKPVQPTPPVAPRVGHSRGESVEEPLKEEKSTKFSRFEDSDSDSEEDFLLDSDSSSPEDRGRRDFDSGSDFDDDDQLSRGSTSSSDAEKSDRASSDEESDRKSVSGDGEQGQSEVNNSEVARKTDDIAKNDDNRSSIKEDQSVQKNDNATNIQVGGGERKSTQKTDNDKRERQPDLRTKLRTDRDRDRNRDRRDRNMPRKEERKEDYYRRHERDKRREEREKNYAARREDRKRSPQRSFRSRREIASVDQRTLEARRQKFASGQSVDIIKDRTIGLKGIKTSENGAEVAEGTEKPSETAQVDKKLATDAVKDAPRAESDSDISLSSEQDEQSDDAEEEKEKEEEDTKDTDSESESDGETSRFKHTSSSDTKIPTLEPARSRLITSMTFPKDGPTDVLPRRRPRDGELGRPRWERDNRGGDRRPRENRDRDRERDFARRPHLPRHLERQERGSSRDRPRGIELEQSSIRDRTRGSELEQSSIRDRPRGSELEQNSSRDRPRGSDLEQSSIRDRTRGSELDSRSTAKDESNDRRVRDKYEGRRHPRERDPLDRVVADERPIERQSKEVIRVDRLSENVDSRPVSRKPVTARDFVSESSESETESSNQPLRSIVKTDKPGRDASITVTRSTERRPRTEDGDEEERSRRKEKSREKRHKHKRDVKDRIGSKKKEETREEGTAEVEMAEVRRVTLSEDAGQKKRSVLDRLGNAPSPERVRSSVKSRLGPVSKKGDSVPINSEEDFLSKESLGPAGDSLKRRTVEIDDSFPDRVKKRVKVTHPDSDDDNITRDETSDMFTVAEPPVQRKQLSKSLLSRLSERPGTPVEAEADQNPERRIPTPDPEPKERRVKARDDDEKSRKKKKEKKSKSREIWSSRRKAVQDDDMEEEEMSHTRERKSEIRNVLPKRNDDMDFDLSPEDRRTKVNEPWTSKRKGLGKDEESDVKVSRDEALDERIRKIKAKNAAILQRQKEIEQEKKMFGGRR